MPLDAECVIVLGLVALVMVVLWFVEAMQDHHHYQERQENDKRESARRKGNG